MSRPNSMLSKGSTAGSRSTVGNDGTTKACVSPPLDYSSVTDDRWTAAVTLCDPPGCISGGCLKTERFYACDHQLAKVLAQHVSPEDRRKVFQWLAALDKMTSDENELSERSLYLTCLLMLLRSGQLVPPFTRMPPEGPVKSLRDVIDKRLYRKVQIECRKRRTYDYPQYKLPDRSVEQRPQDFFDHLPAPNSGVFCYGGAFSSM